MPYAKHAANAASVHNTCLHKLVCYLYRMFNRNLKLKQQVNKLNALKLGIGLCVRKSMHVTFSFAFSSIFAKIPTSNFRKVVWQHTAGVVGSVIWILLEI